MHVYKKIQWALIIALALLLLFAIGNTIVESFKNQEDAKLQTYQTEI